MEPVDEILRNYAALAMVCSVLAVLSGVLLIKRGEARTGVTVFLVSAIAIFLSTMSVNEAQNAIDTAHTSGTDTGPTPP